MVRLHRPLAIPENLVHGLDHAVRRQSAVLFAQVHAPPGGVHPHSQGLRRGKLRVQQSAGAAAGEHIVVVKDGGAPGFQQLAHAHEGAVVNGFPVQIFPNFVQGSQPVKELHVLHLGQIPAKGLVEVVMGVDKAGIDHTARSVQGLVGILRLRAHVDNGPVPDKKIGVFQQGVLPVTGDNGRGVLNQKTAHALPPKYAVFA